MAIFFVLLVVLIPVLWFAGLFGLFLLIAKALPLRSPRLVAFGGAVAFVFVAPIAINALTDIRERQFLTVSETELAAPGGGATFGLVRRMNEVKCYEECQSLLFNGQARRVILAELGESTEPNWVTPQASFVLGDCSDPADLPSRSALAPINIARATGQCIHRGSDTALSEADHTILSGYFEKSYLVGPSIWANTARYYVRDGAEQKLVRHQNRVDTQRLRLPLTLTFNWTRLFGGSSNPIQIVFWHHLGTVSHPGGYPSETDMLRLAGLDPERPLPVEDLPFPDVLIEALAQSDRPKAQDDALYDIARNMVWEPGLTAVNRTFVEAFIDAHPGAFEGRFGERLEMSGYPDLHERLTERLPSEIAGALKRQDEARVRRFLSYLSKQPVEHRTAIFEELMTVLVAASDRSALRDLPSTLTKVEGAGPVFVALLEQTTDWPAADRAGLARAACESTLDQDALERFEAVLRADLAAEPERIADVDLAVSISGLARAGVETVQIALLFDEHLGPLETVPLMPPNVRPITAPRETSLERLNLAWIWQFASGGCRSRGS